MMDYGRERSVTDDPEMWTYEPEGFPNDLVFISPASCSNEHRVWLECNGTFLTAADVEEVCRLLMKAALS